MTQSLPIVHFRTILLFSPQSISVCRVCAHLNLSSQKEEQLKSLEDQLQASALIQHQLAVTEQRPTSPLRLDSLSSGDILEILEAHQIRIGELEGQLADRNDQLDECNRLLAHHRNTQTQNGTHTQQYVDDLTERLHQVTCSVMIVSELQIPPRSARVTVNSCLRLDSRV